jgi:phage-related protein
MNSTNKSLVWLHGKVKTRIDADAVVLVEVFNKKAAATPRAVIDACRKRLREYDNA